MALTVSEVAQLARVSIRALHHYDDIGLLKPSARSDAGYRLYTDADLAVLQQILFFKELGFALEEIRKIMLDPAFDRKEALKMQKRMLEGKAHHVATMIAAVDRALAAMEQGSVMDKNQMFKDFDPQQYEEEAKQRWGHTPAYKESKKRTAKYNAADWKAIQQEGEDINARMVALMDAGHPATHPDVQATVARHWEMINKRFYTCTPEIFAGLAEMYMADSRFTEHYDKQRPGLAFFMSQAMQAFASSKGWKPPVEP